MPSINVEIVFALESQIWRKNLQVLRGSTPEDVIEESGLLIAFPELKSNKLNYGIYSKMVDQHYLMSENDRLEIYRPLKADPKTVRREMAKAGKTMTDQR